MTAQLTRNDVAAIMDYTLLTPEATAQDVEKLCAEAIELGVGCVCVSPNMLHATRDAQEAGLKVAAVVGFPSGKHHILIKAAEARLAVQSGASEIDLVVDLGNIAKGDLNAMVSEVVAVREAISAQITLKVILETALWDDDTITQAAALCAKAGADMVKTSTGFHPAGGATASAVTALAKGAGPHVGVKASGGIRTWEQAQEMIAAGAARLGVSKAREILDGAPA
ncbi:deoxyribose-phosphate aldolase [Corynebacterium aquilae]|uniref:Deoxyribose-phosphate aldolase n=1 Tax=Corynebacterium aquilae DSM 44791 TaxID=1431546 RepID=A0A1L7CDI4_9CORY|nr:deoxyribose-phosphate aldolase [Corynebacterium aquilae]APT83905.1 deoxyribose-phosphate aldolase [Corynebacterium aquilae DSM 44791]